MIDNSKSAVNSGNTTVRGTKELIRLIQKIGPAATKILRKELRGVAKEVAADVKSLVPVDTGFLKRSISVRSVKSKKRFDIAFRVLARPPKEDQYYAFAPEYGVGEGIPGHQQATHPFQTAIDKASAHTEATLKKIAAAIEAAWRKR